MLASRALPLDADIQSAVMGCPAGVDRWLTAERAEPMYNVAGALSGLLSNKG